jgi:hypothetical protein
MALPGIIAVGSALGAYLLAKVRARGGAAKRRGVDPLGAFVDETEVPATPASSGDGAPRALENLRYAVKDIFQIEGRVTGFGSPAWAETHKPARKTARAVAMLADAGATCVGVTHMDEFAYSVSGENAHYGTPRNPAAPGRIPGGSSSGSAVAVAASLNDVAFGLGTDSGGSVRVPAAHCGVFGFRPTHGAVSATGVVKFAPSMDTVGWFARDGETLRKVGDVLLKPRLGKVNVGKVRSSDENDRDAFSALPTKLLVLEDAMALSDPASQCGVASLCAALEDVFPPGQISRLDLGKHLLVLCPSLRTIQSRLPRGSGTGAGDDVTGLDALRFAFGKLMGGEVWASLGDWYTSRPFSERGDTGPGVRQRMDDASKVADDPDVVGNLRESQGRSPVRARDVAGRRQRRGDGAADDAERAADRRRGRRVSGRVAETNARVDVRLFSGGVPAGHRASARGENRRAARRVSGDGAGARFRVAARGGKVGRTRRRRVSGDGRRRRAVPERRRGRSVTAGQSRRAVCVELGGWRVAPSRRRRGRRAVQG